MPGDGARRAGVQLQALPGGDAARVLARPARRARSRSPAGTRRRARTPASTAKQPEAADARPPAPARVAIALDDSGPADARAPRRGRGRHHAPAREAKRALDRAADRARRGVRGPLRGRRRSAASSSPAPAAPSAPEWTRASSAATIANRERLVETSTVAFQAVGDCRRPVVAAVNGPALAGGFALSLALRPARRLIRRPVRLPGAAPRDPAELRGGAGGAAGDGRQGALPHRPGGLAPRGPAARDRARGRRRATCVERALALAERIAGLPRQAILETKRRTLLERHHLWGFLFDEEERVFRRALLGETEVAKA